MKLTLRLLILVLCLCALTTTFLYAQDADTSDIRTITGQIERFSYEGGFYGIKADDGKEYKPLHLNSGMKVEGLRIKATVRVIDRKFLTRGWGIPVEILAIERTVR